MVWIEIDEKTISILSKYVIIFGGTIDNIFFVFILKVLLDPNIDFYEIPYIFLLETIAMLAHTQVVKTQLFTESRTDSNTILKISSATTSIGAGLFSSNKF